MESYIPISYLNDYIFCPRSIYYHQLYQNFDPSHYQAQDQVEGCISHQSIDKQKYSSRKNILQGTYVYNQEYGLCGKIDVYDQNRR